jgi:dTDP-L-rhamnose 4-epimerase
MRILVTGGAGFIGSHVVDALVCDGHDVVAVDALVPQAHGSVAPPWCRDLVIGPVEDAEALRKLLRGVDVVCHQAAAVGHGLNPSDTPMYVHNNDYATAVLLAEMYAAGIDRLVLASSMVVYGEGRYGCAEHGIVRPVTRRASDVDAGRYEPRCPMCDAPLDWQLVPEDVPLEPQSTYAATKVAQEHLAAAWARQTAGSVWAMRYHNVYGPRMPRDTPYAGVASIFRSALVAGRAPQVLEDGRQRRDFVHVTDVARANVLAIEQPIAGFRAVNVCSGEPHTVGEFAATLATAMGGPEPAVVGGARPADVRHIVASPQLATDLLGFRASVPFAAGVAAFATDELRAPAAIS